jgi:hypothetical protein
MAFFGILGIFGRHRFTYTRYSGLRGTDLTPLELSNELLSAEFGQELPKIIFFPFGCSSVLTLKKSV